MMQYPGAKQRKCQLLHCISVGKGALGEGLGELAETWEFLPVEEAPIIVCNMDTETEGRWEQLGV